MLCEVCHEHAAAAVKPASQVLWLLLHMPDANVNPGSYSEIVNVTLL